MGSVLPAPDATGTTAVSGTGGKVALVNSTTALACNGGSTACSAAQLAQILDLVGWDGANFFEGAAAPATTNPTGIRRKAGGCTETDNNLADFELADPPTPRNTASPLSPCGGDVDTAPALSSIDPADGTANVALAANLTLVFSEPVALAPGAVTVSCTGSMAHTVTITPGATPTTFTGNPDSDFASGESCIVTVHAALVTDLDGVPTPMAADVLSGFSTPEACGDGAALIHDIQGSGLQSTMTGASLSIEGIVVADFQAAGQFGGYFVQQEDALADGNPDTSEGIFVFSTAVAVSVGDRVRVRGTVTEFASSGGFLTELSGVAGVLSCSTGNTLPAASVVILPAPSVAALERYEGMRVVIPQTLTVSETFTLARFGELVLSANGRLPQPTNIVAPGAPAIAQQALNDRSRIVLDDGNNQQNIDPTLYPAGGLSAANTVRVGDTVTALTGVLEQRFGDYRVQPTGPVVITPANLRPAAPAAVGPVRVASFNVLNYFNGDGSGGGFPTSRGAETLFEFTRQRDKIINAIVTMDADIVGLMEIENDAAGGSAIEDLVAGLNAATDPGTYAFIDTGVVGTDEIRVAIIYQPATVTPFNAFAVLDSAIDPTFIDTRNRPSLAQTFTRNSNGKRLTVVVNHLKSKGSGCADIGDPDTGDGQGNCNLTRTTAAAALVNWLATDPTGAADPDVILIGDMNSYAKEDPISTFVNHDYVNLIGAHVGAAGYSYVFDGQSGYLDHGLASAALAPRVTGVVEWHINADEPVALDYNVNFKTANQVTTMYADDPFRSSDHDPVVIGLNLIQPFVWSGFSPVSALNLARAGSAIPIKFSLGGNRGLDVFRAGSPSSHQVPCPTGGVTGPFEPTVTAGGSGLSYDAGADRYTYVWKTQKAWGGTCRELVIDLADGTSHGARFSFRK